jgi:long-chain acyl-CoA synthetase
VAATGPWHPRGPEVLADLLAPGTAGDRTAGDRTGGRAPGRYWLQTVPAIAQDVLEAVRRGTLDRPARVVLAGAVVPEALESGWRALGVPVTTYYGAAELSFVAARSTAELRDVPEGLAGERAAGLRPFPGVAVDLRDGELWARSPYTALGYLGEPGPGSWRDGWVSVHDRATLTAEGGLHVLGRGDAAILVGGTTVLAADVESELGAVAGVAEIVCLAEPDARLGQRVVAVVRPAGHDRHLVSSLREAARQRLAPAARPSRYVLRDRLPRTPGGKVARADLAHEISRDVVRDAG